MQLSELQKVIKDRDFKPDLAAGYFMKLVEEVGELAEAIRNDKKFRGGEPKEIKGTIDEELYDILYYVLALANIYGVDLEQAAEAKEVINKQRTDH